MCSLCVSNFDVLDSSPVELTGRVQVLENGDLLISNVRESDAGWYNCIRSNEAGSVTGQAYLGVMGTLFSIHKATKLNSQRSIENDFLVYCSSDTNRSTASRYSCTVGVDGNATVSRIK